MRTCEWICKQYECRSNWFSIFSANNFSEQTVGSRKETKIVRNMQVLSIHIPSAWTAHISNPVSVTSSYRVELHCSDRFQHFHIRRDPGRKSTLFSSIRWLFPKRRACVGRSVRPSPMLSIHSRNQTANMQWLAKRRWFSSQHCRNCVHCQWSLWKANKKNS